MIGAGSGGDRRLLRIFRSLAPDDRRTLLAFAEFLAACSRDGEDQPPADPLPIPRPEHESVVGAVKRLSRSYFMLERSGTMLNETSALMAGHVLHGRPAAEVIDELEALFARYFAEYRERRQG
jgi:hypothetical protein